MNKLTEKTIILAITIIICALIVLSLCGCQKKSSTGIETNRFVRVESQYFNFGAYVQVFYDRETKVMYVFYKSGYGGGLCPMYNSDGTLMLYEY